MAANDYHVIVYQILAYLYSCLTNTPLQIWRIIQLNKITGLFSNQRTALLILDKGKALQKQGADITILQVQQRMNIYTRWLL